MTPFGGTRVVFVGRMDEERHAHNALRRRAMERLGCTVVSLDPEESSWLDRLAGRTFETRFSKALASLKPDLVLTVGGIGLDPPALHALRVGSPATWVNWFPGDLRAARPAKQLAAAYDRIYLSGTDVVEDVRAHGASNAEFLALACDPSVHKPLRAKGPFRANVVFAGEATEHREELLTELVEFGLALWGESWRKTSLRDYCRGTLPSVEDYVRANAGATVAVNIHHASLEVPPVRGGSLNERVFELAAIGVAQVVDGRGDLAAHFEDGREVLAFETPAELKGQVKRALQENSYRERLAGAARQRALSEHTYMHRLSRLLHEALRPKRKSGAEPAPPAPD
jgi:spore maturation protein CgeB